MRYMGSKRRLAKHILPIILKDREPEQLYVEPFVGGCNSIDKVDGPRVGSDLNGWIIAMWQAVQRGWVPPSEVSEEEYEEAKDIAKHYSVEHAQYMFGELIAAWVGFIGTGCSFGGMWFSSYARGKGDNYAGQSQRSVLRQAEALQNVKFLTGPYYHLNPLLADNPESIIYCDPPYAGTAGYGFDWDAEEFWRWCRTKVNEGHCVFVSEYTAPAGWVPVFEKEHSSNMNARVEKKNSSEKLFVHRSQA